MCVYICLFSCNVAICFVVSHSLLGPRAPLKNKCTDSLLKLIQFALQLHLQLTPIITCIYTPFAHMHAVYALLLQEFVMYKCMYAFQKSLRLTPDV